MKAPFTDNELKILRGLYPKLSKTLGTSDTYLKNIANGKQKVKSALSKKCFKKLQDTVKFLTPIA
jgi:hypothetical protein